MRKLYYRLVGKHSKWDLKRLTGDQFFTYRQHIIDRVMQVLTEITTLTIDRKIENRGRYLLTNDNNNDMR